jgi:hypothetical protein
VSEESARTQTEGERERETTEPERPIGGGNQRRVFKSEKKKNNGVKFINKVVWSFFA